MAAKGTKRNPAGIRFFNCVWNTGEKYQNTTEHAYSRRHMSDKIRVTKEVSYTNDDGSAWELVKIQEIETPMIEIAWLLDLFTTAGKKADRIAHAEQAAYIIRLIESCAARVLFEDGRVVER